MLRRPGKLIVSLTLAVTLALYLLSKPTLGALLANPLQSAAQIAALLGVVLFAINFMLASRIRLVEEAFGGLDRAYGFHHEIGVWSFGFLAAHFAAVAANALVRGLPLGKLMTGNIFFLTGEISLALMAAIILAIIYAKFKYQHFMLVQKFFIIPFSLGVFHLAIVSSDVSRYAPLRIFILTVSLLGVVAWIWREFFYSALGPQAAYAIKSVERRGGGIVEFSLSPEGRPLSAGAGHFAYVSFRSGKVSSEPHPFSFTSAPGSAEVSFAAKALGDYTRTLADAAPGDKVAVYGPYGKFFENLGPAAENIFVAGGIGITPFLSAVRAGDLGAQTTLFYCANSETDAVYDKELRALSVRPGAFRYHLHESDRRGLITADIIEKRANGLAGKTIYLCGPAGMMAALTKQFVAKGVPRERIVYESFSY